MGSNYLEPPSISRVSKKVSDVTQCSGILTTERKQHAAQEFLIGAGAPFISHDPEDLSASRGAKKPATTMITIITSITITTITTILVIATFDLDGHVQLNLGCGR